MYRKSRYSRRAACCAAAVLSLALAGCTQSMDAIDDIKTSSTTSTRGYSTKERDCLARAMFFESIRSSRDGLVAVGTVVMNRVESDRYPDTICGVVGQKNQFAPGVLSRKMNPKALPDVMAAADDVLRGERHPKVGKAKFFHQAGLKFPYKNMHYVLEAGGNAFYEKRSRRKVQVAEAPADATAATMARTLSYAVEPKAADAIGAMLASQKRPSAPD